MDKKEEPKKPVEEVDDDDDEEEEDLFNKRIENSGCSKQHYELQVKNQISKKRSPCNTFSTMRNMPKFIHLL